MRDLNECTEEVFRRSEKRIKERARNRNRILALCIPVCLIITVWSVIIFPGMMPVMETGDYAQAAGEIVGDADGSLACPYVSVEIQDAGMFPEEHYGKVTDTVAVAEMFQAIHSLFADADGNAQGSNGNLPASEIFPAEEDNACYDQAESTSKWKDYTIIFTTEEGAQAVYNFSENTLVNVGTNETIFLSDAQAAELLAVLGILE